MCLNGAGLLSPHGSALSEVSACAIVILNVARKGNINKPTVDSMSVVQASVFQPWRAGLNATYSFIIHLESLSILHPLWYCIGANVLFYYGVVVNPVPHACVTL